MDYHTKYTNLKRKLKLLLYEQEGFHKELEKSQLKLIRVSRDKSFLLDRLLVYENVSGDSSNDSDATLSSDNDFEPPMKKRAVAAESPIVKAIKTEVEDQDRCSTSKPKQTGCERNPPSKVVVKQEYQEGSFVQVDGRDAD